MKKYTRTLDGFQQTFATYLNLGGSGYDFEVEAYENFLGEFDQYFTDEEESLCIKIDGLILIAGERFDEVAAQEQLDQESDERSYEGSRHLS